MYSIDFGVVGKCRFYSVNCVCAYNVYYIYIYLILYIIYLYIYKFIYYICFIYVICIPYFYQSWHTALPEWSMKNNLKAMMLGSTVCVITSICTCGGESMFVGISHTHTYMFTSYNYNKNLKI